MKALVDRVGGKTQTLPNDGISPRAGIGVGPGFNHFGTGTDTAACT